MAILNFKGKTFVQNHHLAVKYHQLVPKKDKSFTDKVSLNDNLIIHGDNLKALKALLPTYAGKVKCIYIDPPYNTGNERWVYNDNVNSPMMQEWLGKVVDREDLTRHDKWLCMMMPRLKILRELLSEDGVIFVNIDDNEVHHLRMLMDEVAFITDIIIWRKSGDSRWGKMKNVTTFRKDHEYILVGYKNKEIQFNKLLETPKFYTKSSNPDNDLRGDWFPGSISQKEEASDKDHPNYYTVISPSKKSFTRRWDFDRNTFDKQNRENRIYWGPEGKMYREVKFLKMKKERLPLIQSL
jgi:adenine-specific DNA-methyltransferase